MIHRLQAIMLAKAQALEQRPAIHDEVPMEQVDCYRYPFERALESYKKKLPDLESLLIQAGPVLDLGAGLGIAAAQMREQYSCRIYATGVAAIAHPLVPFVLATAPRLPFADGAFALVVSVQAISWEPDQVGAVREVGRVLAEGGVGLLFFTTFSYSVDHRWGDTFWEEAGADPVIYRQSYEFSPAVRIAGSRLEVRAVPMKHPYRNHTHAYYVIIRKLTTTS